MLIEEDCAKQETEEQSGFSSGIMFSWLIYSVSQTMQKKLTEWRELHMISLSITKPMTMCQ